MHIWADCEGSDSCSMRGALRACPNTCMQDTVEAISDAFSRTHTLPTSLMPSLAVGGLPFQTGLYPGLDGKTPCGCMQAEGLWLNRALSCCYWITCIKL